ncbi:Osmolarity sensor protein EnvZ [Pseudovibrio axinellae]|uniref:histidine kinase n=1 Tax=Pseudovibrio axinellae TaxID=989403 RepID=A0A166AVK8_9HYPH|nr:ATP-binding protein [Pseudovibrio axinellae]KZL21606.1 Osmolarity sensor protein EnvZ [Pseudovibrio axinellae]SER11404.1 two-component system, OmpR family, osmolarity sensor histidine kinase EnvZ [Pseudovibrio axinellae]
MGLSDRFKLPKWVRTILAPYYAFTSWLHYRLPKGLYVRSLLIIVIPFLILQSVLAFVFMERHYDLVTRRLSEAVVREIAAVVDMAQNYAHDDNYATLKNISASALGLSVSVLPKEPLPAPKPKPLFDLVDRYMTREIAARIGRPFWIDTAGASKYVEIRIQLEDKTLRIIARRSQTYASNSHIFIVWMVATSLVLIIISVLFLRNQIRPIEKLADAAEEFGKGRQVSHFRPHGAREVRRAALSFIDMRRRIERHVDQRTTMLAGVSHDLRTILTRFRLELALLDQSPESDALRRDVDEMNRMLEDYLSFSKGYGDEPPAPVDIALMLEDLEVEAEVVGADVASSFDGDPLVILKGRAFRRCLLNVISNAARYGRTLRIKGNRTPDWLIITVDDDGPGIPREERENVFRPFHRLDTARNQDSGGSGLGLSIARDIVRSHGGEVFLRQSPLGGLRVRIRVPI